MEIPDKRGVENVVVDHLTRLEKKIMVEEPRENEESFPGKQLMIVDTSLRGM